jgi:hypothetical protein
MLQLLNKCCHYNGLGMKQKPPPKTGQVAFGCSAAGGIAAAALSGAAAGFVGGAAIVENDAGTLTPVLHDPSFTKAPVAISHPHAYNVTRVT